MRHSRVLRRQRLVWAERDARTRSLSAKFPTLITHRVQFPAASCELRDRKRHHIDSRVSLSLSLYMIISRKYSRIPKGRAKIVLHRFPFTSPLLSDKKARVRVWRTRIDISYSIPDAIRRSTIVLPEIRCSRVSTGSVVSQQTVGHTRNSTVFPQREQNFSSLPRRNEDPEEVTFIRTAAIAASQPNRERRSSSAERKIKNFDLAHKGNVNIAVLLRILFALRLK